MQMMKIVGLEIVMKCCVAEDQVIKSICYKMQRKGTLGVIRDY